MSKPTSQSKKILGPFEKIVLIASLLLLVYLAFKRGGFKVAEKTEEVQIIDNPHANEWQKKKRDYTPPKEEKNPSVEAVLAEMADQFSKGEKGTNSGLSKDEANYLDDIQDKYRFDEQVKNAKDWFAVLKASHSTYNKVKSLFDEVNETSVKSDKVDEVLKDKEKADEVYYKLQDWFGISKEDISAFAKSGKKAVSDWAEFVENQTDERRTTND